MDINTSYQNYSPQRRYFFEASNDTNCSDCCKLGFIVGFILSCIPIVIIQHNVEMSKFTFYWAGLGIMAGGTLLGGVIAAIFEECCRC